MSPLPRPVHEMSNAELIAEAERRAANRKAGRPLDYVPPEVTEAERAEAERNARIDEKNEQRAIRKMAIALGFRVYWLSQARDSKQTPGLPDLWLAMEAIGFCCWWETKRQVGGSRSQAQEDFGDECNAARIPYGHGDRHDFASWLKRRGFTPPPVPED